jgi:hypothetical protein
VRFVVVMAFMVVSSTGRASDSVPVTAEEVLAQADHEGRACGVEEDGASSVICGGAFLADLVRSEHLVMDRDTCSRLLEELFEQQSCEPGDAECGQLRSCTPPPPPSRVLTGSGAAVSVVEVSANAEDAGAALARAQSETPASSRRARPPTPPPRS